MSTMKAEDTEDNATLKTMNYNYLFTKNSYSMTLLKLDKKHSGFWVPP